MWTIARRLCTIPNLKNPDSENPMTPPITRRRFMAGAAAGSAVVVLPRFLAGCNKAATLHGAVSETMPANPFFEWFGIDEALIRALMSELTAHGADFADLYFQHSRSNSLTMEDGIISRAACTVDQGVGLRVVVGDQTGYAFTEDLSPEAMRAAARTAASIAHGSQRVAPVDLTFPAHPSHYPQVLPWSQVPVADKLPLVERLEALARAADPAVDKVTVSWADQDRDTSAWFGNKMQRTAFETAKSLEKKVLETKNKKIIDTWRRLMTSDHFYYMSTKLAGDEEVHSYFRDEVYENPYEAFANYMNIIQDFRMELDEELGLA